MLPPRYRFSTTIEEFDEQNTALLEQGYAPVELGFEDDIVYTKYSANTETNTILSAGDFDEFLEIIPSQQEEGYQLVDVRYSDIEDEGVWVGEFRNDVIPTTHFYTDSLDEFKTYAGEQFEQNIGLIDLEYGDGTIFATFADTPRRSGYIYSDDYDEFVGLVYEQTVLDAFNSGVTDLVDIEYIDGTYVAVTNGFLGASSYAFNYSDYDEFQAEIQRQIERGESYGQDFSLVDVEHINGSWYGVLNDNSETIDHLSLDYTAVPDSILTQAQITGEAFSFNNFVLPNL